MQTKLYLAIETSCDETSLALLEQDQSMDTSSFYNKINSFKVLGSIISSQINTHAKYGGVVPEIGARQHADQIHILFQTLISQIRGTKITENYLEPEEKEFLSQIQTIFVTTEPGLVSALRVGVEFAKTLQFYLKLQSPNKTVEIVEINHLRGHSVSNFYQPEKNLNIPDDDLFPHLHLLVSGGNSQIILMESAQNWKIVGQTLDDAAGECFDKIGRMLGLPYPGGVYLAKIAEMAEYNFFDFPVSMIQNQSLDYSFSGLKTAVRYFLQASEVEGYNFEAKLTNAEIDLLMSGKYSPNPKLELVYKTCVSAQTVIVRQLLNKIDKGIKIYQPNSIGLSGGVSANLLLRSKFENLSHKQKLKHVFFPALSLSGDNAIMIALAGLIKLKTKNKIRLHK